MKGLFTGQWVSRDISGRWKRTEYFKVGDMINEYQYRVFLDNMKDYPAIWGDKAVEGAITFVRLCCECNDHPARSDDYLCWVCREALNKNLDLTKS